MARLEQEHARLGAAARDLGRDDAPGGPRADDDDVPRRRVARARPAAEARAAARRTAEPQRAERGGARGGGRREQRRRRARAAAAALAAAVAGAPPAPPPAALTAVTQMPPRAFCRCSSSRRSCSTALCRIAARSDDCPRSADDDAAPRGASVAPAFSARPQLRARFVQLSARSGSSTLLIEPPSISAATIG